MDKIFLKKEIKNLGKALKINRMRVANLVLNNAELFPYLIELTFEVNEKTSIKAAWVLEIVCEHKIDWLTPHLSYFTNNIKKVHFDSAVRAIAKTCNFLAIAYNSKNNSLVKNVITKTQLNKIIETGFDWMISQHKVAVKAYTMNALFLFGKEYNWVHQELKLIIQQNMAHESAAYKARGRMTLELINKK